MPPVETSTCKKSLSVLEPNFFLVFMSFKKIEISEITFFDADGNELIGAWATSRPRLASKVTPSPHPGQGAYTGTLWDPLAKIAPGQVAGNSNLKFGVRPRASCMNRLRADRRRQDRRRFRL